MKQPGARRQRNPTSTTLSWKGADLRHEQHDAKRRLILKQAARMFAEKGFHQTTIEQIAEALDVTKPTIYYYIDSKDDILYKILQTTLVDLDAELARETEPEGLAIDRLEKFLKVYTKIMLSEFGVCMSLVSDRSLNPEYRRKIRALKKEYELRVRAIISDGQEDGSITVEHPGVFAYAIFGAYNWMPHWFSARGKLTQEKVGDELFQIFRRSLRR